MSNPEPEYGARFALARSKLRQLLEEMGPGLLASLADADRAQTLELLKEHSSMDSNMALEVAAGLTPEELALSILHEHLLPSPPPCGEARWGAQFLRTWREHIGPLSCFSYTQLQELKQADRETTLLILQDGIARLERRKRARLLEEHSAEAFAKVFVAEYHVLIATGYGRSSGLWRFF